MRQQTCYIFVTLITVVSAADAVAQASGAPQGQPTASVSATSARRDAGFTGINVRGRPSPAPDGSPRWADYPVVHRVTPGSPAERVGIAVGDVLLLVNGADARDPRTLFIPPGTELTVRVRRGSAMREFVLTVEQRRAASRRD
jgi:C-terminal processing protease CtpA/Prc